METKRELLNKLRGKKTLFESSYGGIDIAKSGNPNFYHLIVDISEELIMTEMYYEGKMQDKYYYVIEKITSIQKIW